MSNTPTQPEAEDELTELIGNLVKDTGRAFNSGPEIAMALVPEYCDKFEAALKQWAYAEAIAALPHKDQCICDKTDENCITCERVQSHNQAINTAAANLKQRFNNGN